MNAPFLSTRFHPVEEANAELEALVNRIDSDAVRRAQHADIQRRVAQHFAAPHPQELSQRNKEVMRAYNGVINDDTAQGRAARHVRDTLLARQVLDDVPPVLSRCVDQDADWHALMFKDGPLTPAEQAMVDAVERGAA